MELDSAGRDQLGRRVSLAFTPELSDIGQVAFPEGAFVVLIAGPTAHLPVDVIYAAAEELLGRGAVYVMCWGDGSSRCEDIVDEAVVMRTLDEPDAPAIMTTSHAGTSIEEVLEFAITVAVPADELAEVCREVVLVFHENVHFYNEAHLLLEEMLRDGGI